MIGLIVCGHGNFATGLKSAVTLMAGQHENFEAVDFTEELTTADLKEKLSAAIKNLDKGKGVIIFTDIAGGSPFKQAALLAHGGRNIKVFGGTNMNLLLDVLYLRKEYELEPLVQQLLQLSKKSIRIFETKPKEPQNNNNEGI
jgi:PTS system N-acetylgalactosamine-specific IIA component